MARDIVIGDVHGCIEELDELLRIVQHRPSDRLVFAGDLVDRGPDSIGVIRRVRELRAACVMGNHDEWYVRAAKHAAAEQNGKPNPMRKNERKWSLFCELGGDDVEFLAKLPLWYRLDSSTVVVHAGMRPGVPVDQQDKQDLLRLRYLDRRTGKRWNMDSDELLTPDVAAYWTELWTGPDEVVYGHHPSKTDTAYTCNADVACWGIDTGCCFGNKLTAWVRDGFTIRLVSVPAKEQYANWHHSMSD